MVDGNVAVGVPEITQVLGLILAHAGKAGEILQFVMVAPLSTKVEGVTLMKFPKVPTVPVDPL